MTNRQRYTGCTRVYRVYKGVQGVKEYTGYTRVYGLYKSIPGRQEYTRCTSIHGVRKYTECTVAYRANKDVPDLFPDNTWRLT